MRKKALEIMLLTRFMDEKCFKLSRQNKGGTFQLSTAGHELVGAMGALHLKAGTDWALPYYRDRAVVIGLGTSLTDLLGAFLAREVPHHSGGRMMPEHFVHRELRIPCQSSCVGSQFLHAVGVAKANQIQGKQEAVYVSAGDGATSQGDFHEALNFSCIHKLGVIFVIQDNGWAISVPVSEQTAGGSIAPLGRGYSGLEVFDIDGCSFSECDEAFSQAVKRAREGKGPTLIVAHVPRMGSHSNSDDPTKYQGVAFIEKERAKDPLPRFERELLAAQEITEEELAALQEKCFKAIEEAAQVAEALPFPDPKTATDKVFLATEAVPEGEKCLEESIVMVDALNHALDEEMKRDPGVVVFGEDVAHGKGGVFGVTRHLTEKYGTSRCFNTPLAESTIIGIAIGMSFVPGCKPVAEIQFADYVWPGIDQIFSELSSIHYRSNGEWHCPVVVRLPSGGYIQGGPYHSQSIEGFLAHCPGLKIVIPSNASDAKRLLKAAIRDPNPVLFLEHKALYRQRLFSARPEPLETELLPFGKAKVVREGSHVTVLAWGMAVCMAFEGAEQLAKEGIEAEVIDARTLVPFDEETLFASVRKTGKLLIVHEAPKSCGFGAEVAARVAEGAFDFLDAPIRRVGAKEAPVPYSLVLEAAILPQKEEIRDAIRSLALY